MWLHRIDNKIAAVRQREAEQEHGRRRRPPVPDWISPFTGPGKGCRASFLMCLGCTNARIHPGHHERLAQSPTPTVISSTAC